MKAAVYNNELLAGYLENDKRGFLSFYLGRSVL